MKKLQMLFAYLFGGSRKNAGNSKISSPVVLGQEDRDKATFNPNLLPEGLIWVGTQIFLSFEFAPGMAEWIKTNSPVDRRFPQFPNYWRIWIKDSLFLIPRNVVVSYDNAHLETESGYQSWIDGAAEGFTESLLRLDKVEGLGSKWSRNFVVLKDGRYLEVRKDLGNPLIWEVEGQEKWCRENGTTATSATTRPSWNKLLHAAVVISQEEICRSNAEISQRKESNSIIKSDRETR